MAIFITTTQTVTFADLGGREIVHPTTDLEITLEYTTNELANSADFQDALSNGWITAEDENENPITNDILENSFGGHVHSNKEEIDKITDGDHDVAIGNPHNATTSDISEGTNKYYTENRVSANTDVISNTAHRNQIDNPHAVTAAQIGAAETLHTHVVDDITDFDTNVFGTEYNYIKNDKDQYSSGTSWSTALTLSASNLPSGKYYFAWNCETTLSRTNSKVEISVTQNWTQNIGEIVIEPKDTSNWYPYSGFKEMTISGDHNFYIDFRSSARNATAGIRRVRMILWRIS